MSRSIPRLSARIPPPRAIITRSQYRSLFRTPILGKEPATSTSDPNFKPNLDRHTLKPESDEYSKTGGDHAAAAQKSASFDPKNLDVEGEKDIAGKGVDVNPLDVSPANREVSQARAEDEGMPESGVERTSASRRGGAKKGKEVRQYEESKTGS